VNLLRFIRPSFVWPDSNSLWRKIAGAGQRIPKTVPSRFSLDETFDIGQDMGTPVLEEYADKMPFPFTGTLKKFVVVLEPQKLSEDELKRLHEELAKALAAVQ
jgi:arylsulfatase